MKNRGDRFGLAREKELDDEHNILVFLQIDQDRRCFIPSGSLMAEGMDVAKEMTMHRKKLRQIDDASIGNGLPHVGMLIC